MNKIWSVLKREYLQIVKTKGFLVSTILGPVLMIAMVGVPVLLAVATKGEKKTIAVVDATGALYDGLAARLGEYKMGDGSPRFTLEPAPAGASIEAARADLGRRIMAKTLSAAIVIPSDVWTGGRAEYVSRHVSDFEEIRDINQALTGAVVERRLAREGLDPARVSEFIKPVSLRTMKATERGEEEDRGGTFAVSYILVLILYMTMFFYGAIIMRGVIEEKNNRVVEVILSSLKPFQLMMGKILGIGAVGLTQYSIWALFGWFATKYGASMAGSMLPSASGLKLPTVPGYIWLAFVVFFLLGYFLFATIYAAVGSAVNSEKEAQQLLTPVTITLVIPIMMMTMMMRSPNAPVSVALSLVPFFAPILMMMRITILLPPLTQIAASVALLLLANLGMIWLAAKIYRVGILMYGQRPSLPQILKWVRYK